MTELYLIRHTQAEGNLYRVMQGSWDGAVTENGLRQIDLLSERFRDIPVDAVWSSDLFRARMTATAVTRHRDLPLHTSVLLREIDVGPWETRFFGDLAHESPELIRSFISSPELWRLPGAETYRDVAARAYPELCRIAEENAGRTVAVVSHGVTIRCIMSRILGAGNPFDFRSLPIFGNTAVTHLFYDGASFCVDYMNDSSHLGPRKAPEWERTPDVRGEPFFPKDDREFYTACYRDAWIVSHGSDADFSPDVYFRCAVRHARTAPGAVQRLLIGERVIGLLDLDTQRGAREGIGWVSLLYLLPEFRRKGLGIQALARPIMYYKALGRTRLQLNVAEDNKDALVFYRKYGFETVSSCRASGGNIFLMEKKLGD